MAGSFNSFTTGKLHVGAVPSSAISGLTFSSFIPGLLTASGPAYFGACPGLGVDVGTVNIGPKLPAPGICSLNVLGAPVAAQLTGITNVIGTFNVSGMATKGGADVKASVSVTAGATVEAASTANAANNSTAGNITCSSITASFGAFSSVAAPFKKFDIPHPTRGKGWRLTHASLEGPEMGVYYRGKTKEKSIELPHYWTGLVHEDSITVQLTPIGKACSTLHVKKIENNVVYVGHQAQDLEYYYIIHAERKDLDDLIIEYRGEKTSDFGESSEKIKRSGETLIYKQHGNTDPLPTSIDNG